MKITSFKSLALALSLTLAPQISLANEEAPASVAKESLSKQIKPNQSTDRYTLQREGNAFVRLDNATGELSRCELISKNLICRLSADERSAYEKEISNLQSQIEDLKKLEENESPSSNSSPSKNEHSKSDLDKLDSEMEEVIAYSGKVVKRFFEVMKDIKKDFEAN